MNLNPFSENRELNLGHPHPSKYSSHDAIAQKGTPMLSNKAVAPIPLYGEQVCRMCL